ncbi:MAG: hydrogenase expression/formation protein HypE [Zoogloeaceae bacterium]|jgi:hydrogenase expression/formation protein HypE|nr:hydrogenase expression/formation protein HypE [Zoogloeaceae bacterium]
MNRKHPKSLDKAAGRVELIHGAGGRATAQLVGEIFAPHFNNEWLAAGDDGAVLPALMPNERLVLATDAHVVSPLFFPGGDIGSLAVHGTINDVAVMGARPLWLAAAFILEEGFPLACLDRIAKSMAEAAREAGISIVTGDTKVVEKGKGDGVFIATTGAGALAEGLSIGGAGARPGDAVLISGTLGDHGMAIMNARAGLEGLEAGMGFASSVVSDTASLHGLIAALLATGIPLHVLRDPTRGGLGATVNEIAHQSGVGMLLDEAAIPVLPAVSAACEFLGLDFLYLANEGKLVIICPPESSDAALAVLHAHPLGKNAARIGEVVADTRCFVEMRTRLGGRRMVDWLSGDQLPRIC